MLNAVQLVKLVAKRVSRGMPQAWPPGANAFARLELEKLPGVRKSRNSKGKRHVAGENF